MEKQWVCKICSKAFSGGKAMGGHMRSHLAKFNPPPNTSNSTPASSSVLSLRSATSSFSNSDTDCHSTDYTKRRSKRPRKIDEPDSDQVSSVSETFSVEDMAKCLVMMSRDSWHRKGKLKEEEEDSDSVKERVEDEVSSDEGEGSVRRSKKRPRNYTCDKCGKVFGSYQALGGHKASHKKMNGVKQEVEEVSNGERENLGSKLNAKNRIFQCPLCVKMFDSGQALGGHKKVHFSQMGSSKISAPSSQFEAKQISIDLNLLPPENDDEQGQVEK